MRVFAGKSLCRGWMRDQDGATSIEYAVIACGVAVAIAGAVNSVGTAMMTNFYDRLTTLF